MNGFDLSTISAAYLGSTAISEIYFGSTKVWPKVNYKEMPLTFEIWGSSSNSYSIIFICNNYGNRKTIQYRINEGSWTSVTSTTNPGKTITVHGGDIVQFKGDNTSYSGNFLRSMVSCEVMGNIMSLLDSTNFATLTTISSGTNNFQSIFGSSGVTYADHLILPATTLTTSCYSGMFNSCPYLETTPELPATTLAMSCYNSMFANCSSLTTAPELPAPTLVSGCYSGIFASSSNLRYIKCLATNISASGCTSGWVSGVAATGTFVKASTMSSWTTGTSGIPSGWTVQNA